MAQLMMLIIKHDIKVCGCIVKSQTQEGTPYTHMYVRTLNNTSMFGRATKRVIVIVFQPFCNHVLY